MANLYFYNRFLAEIKKAILDSTNATALNHPVIRGNIRESGIGKIIMQLLPDGWDIGKGQIHDAFGNQSGEIDLIIYNKGILPPLLFNEKEGIFPIESCLYAIEIKTKSTATEIKSTIEKFEKLHSLKPLTNNVGKVHRIYFAYDSDLSDKTEFDRYKQYDEKYYWSPSIPIISVLNKGYWFYFNESNDKQNFKSKWCHIPSDGNYIELLGLLAGISNTVASENSTLRGMPGIGSYILEDKSDLTFLDERTYKFEKPIE